MPIPSVEICLLYIVAYSQVVAIPTPIKYKFPLPPPPPLPLIQPLWTFSYLVDWTERNSQQAAESWTVATAGHVPSGEHEVIIIPLLIQCIKGPNSAFISDRLACNPSTPHREVEIVVIYSWRFQRGCVKINIKCTKLFPVSIKHGLRTTECGLGIKHGQRYKTQTNHYGLGIKYEVWYKTWTVD